MKLKKSIILIFGLFFMICCSTAQTVSKLVNTVLTDITKYDCNIELQISMKPLCLGFDTTKYYYKDVKNIILNPILGHWETEQFDNYIETKSHNILIKKTHSDCVRNERIWHCKLSPVSFNSDTTIALIQYSKSIALNTETESGTILYKNRNGNWTRHFVIEISTSKTGTIR